MPKIKMKFCTATVTETFESFLNSRKASGVVDKTIQTYRYHFAALGKYLNMGVAIDELTRRDLETAIAAMRNSTLSANSIRTYVITLRSFLSWCRAESLTDVDIKPYKGEESVKDTYTVAELKRLLKKPQMRSCTFAEYRNWVIVNLLVNSGCRAATLRNMHVADVNLTGGTIIYRHTKNKNFQIVPLCSEMISILREYLRVRDGAQQDYLFPNDSGEMMTENGLRCAIKRYNLSRGVEKTSIHLFRHTFAERYLMNGGNAFNLQKLLGHSTLDMTKHYCRIYDAEIAKDYDKFSPLATLK